MLTLVEGAAATDYVGPALRTIPLSVPANAVSLIGTVRWNGQGQPTYAGYFGANGVRFGGLVPTVLQTEAGTAARDSGALLWWPSIAGRSDDNVTYDPQVGFGDAEHSFEAAFAVTPSGGVTLLGSNKVFTQSVPSFSLTCPVTTARAMTTFSAGSFNATQIAILLGAILVDDHGDGIGYCGIVFMAQGVGGTFADAPQVTLSVSGKQAIRAIYRDDITVVAAPPSGRRIPVPGLRIELFDNDPANFGPDDCAGIIWDAHKVGWAQWSRFPPQAFFTLRKGSVSNGRIVAGLSHVRIWYEDQSAGYGPELVFIGRIGDADETRDDVVWRCHGYLAELALSRTGYRIMYQGKTIRQAVLQEINKDKSKGKLKNYGARKQTYSLFEHVGLGTVNTPTTDSGRKIKLESGFGVIDVPRLLFLFDLTEIARANTAKNVTMEVTRSINPTFNFWGNRGTDHDYIGLRVPGNVRDYRFVRGVANVRNDLASIGTRKGQAREIKATRSDGTYGYETFGRRQDTFSIRTLAGFRNLDEEAGRFSAQKMIVRRAVREATRPTRELAIDIPVQRMQPFDGWEIEDTLMVEIDDGRTQLDTRYRIVGVQGMMDGSGYRQTLYVIPKDA